MKFSHEWIEKNPWLLIVLVTLVVSVGGAVEISTKAENGAAFLTVADNGDGISAEHLPRIFDRFYRVDSARTSSQGRSGLGLAISKAIIEAHGGNIEATSKTGTGSVFTVRLPMI